MSDHVTRPPRGKLVIVVTTCLLTSLASGCSGLNWTRLDGSSADEARLEKALQTCRVERKLEGLERAREDRSRALGEAKSNQQKMVAREDYAEIERQVYQEIDTCMYRQGFRRPG
jgi:hypothetical protein